MQASFGTFRMHTRTYGPGKTVLVQVNPHALLTTRTCGPNPISRHHSIATAKCIQPTPDDCAHARQDTPSAEQNLRASKPRRTRKRKAPGRGRKPAASSARTDPASDPGALKQWLQRTVGARLARFRKAQLLAGYRLHNCLVAAEQDRSTVRVRILQPRNLITTIRGAPPRPCPPAAPAAPPPPGDRAARPAPDSTGGGV